jgi:predicted ATP-dependent serine protease
MPRDTTMKMCPSCKQLNVPGAIKTGVSETVLMSDVSKREKVRRPRIPVGIFGEPVGEPGDEDFRPGLFGRDPVTNTWGLPDSSVIMIAGPPGAGKSTLFLMLCEMVLNFYKAPTDEALYISNEQSEEDLEAYGLRLGLVNFDRIRLYNAMGQGLQHTFAVVMEKYKPRIMVVDSFSNLLETHGLTADQGITVVNEIKDCCVKSRTVALLVNQINKEGEHKGMMDVLHKGDIILNLDKDDVTGERQLYSTKNRFGQAPVEIRMRMQAEGEERPGWLVPV